MSYPSAETTQEQLRYGLLQCDQESLWNCITPDQADPWKGQLQNWTGKTDDLRRNLPVVETLAQFREADLDPLRTMAMEMRANCQDILLVGSTAMMDLARLCELFDGPGGCRLHVPRSKAWQQQLLPALEGIGSKVGMVILGWSPGEPNWERTVPPALAWMRSRYREDELARRLCAISARNVGQLLGESMQHIRVSERTHLAPIYSGFGLFPMFLAGFEASSLIEGARSQVRALEKSWSMDNPIVRHAICRQVLAHEGWAEVVAIPDRFLEPLGLWVQRLLEVGSSHADPPPPYPFPHLQCQDYDPHPVERFHCYELQLDYAAPELDLALMDRGRPRCWLGMPRLDLYTLGGLMSHLLMVTGLNHRWNEVDPVPIEVD